MAEWLYLAQLWVASGVGVVSLILGFARRKPSVLTIGAIALVELGLLIQLAFSISVVFLGERAKSDTVEYFAYLIVAMIVPVAAGGTVDIVARMLAQELSKNLGQSVVVENRPSSASLVGTQLVAKAAPDGYTIGFLNTPNLLSIPIERQSTFHWKDYDLIGNLIDDPGAFTVHNSSEFKTLKDLVAYAKANPGKVTVGSTGVGSDDHLAMLFFEKAAGVKLTHVPYKGSGETRAAVVSGQLVVGAINVGEALAYIKGGSPIRMLGQIDRKSVV